jgi:transposase InsO family protein
MPWKVTEMTDARREFVELASQEDTNISELCVGFGISRKTAYKWLNRYRKEGVSGLEDRSRRPGSCPGQTGSEMEALVISLREAHPAWGGRKLGRRLQDQGVLNVPAASTITEILRRRGKLSVPERPHNFERFERSEPNELWQMDFKGHFAMGTGLRCHPLTVLDDHSRYSVVLQACANEQTLTVQERLVAAFRCYGLPESMLMDNGSPWGDTRESPWTPLTVWLLRLGVRVLHGRPYHPQTQGKEERFHRSLKAEVLQGRMFRDLVECQERFDSWRVTYNHERPHESLDMAVPGTRYRRSHRVYPEKLPDQEFSPIDTVRKVQQGGRISWHGREWILSKAFTGERVGLRPTTRDGEWDVWYGLQLLGMINQHADAECRRVVRRPREESGDGVVGEERTPLAPLTASVPPPKEC